MGGNRHREYRMLRTICEDVNHTTARKNTLAVRIGKRSDGRYAVIKVEPRVIVLKVIDFEDVFFWSKKVKYILSKEVNL